jgi:hypothetical protein
MSEPGSISAIVEASSGTAAPNAAGAATPRLAIHFADTANFIKALADSLLEQGVPQDAPPFSVRSFTTDASNIPLYGVDGDGYTKTLHEISAIADRGQEMLAFLGKHRNFGRFAMPQSPGPSRANLNTGGGRRWTRRAGSIARAFDLLVRRIFVVRGGSAPKRHRSATTSPNEPPKGASPMGDDLHMASLGEGIAEAVHGCVGQAPAFASFAEIEKE